MAYNWRLNITYDGTNYSGWQIQPNAITVQQTIQDAFYTVTRQKNTLIGAGRTDQGVHAVMQVAHVKTAIVIDPEKTIKAVNSLLPKDIRILSISSVPLNFHAQKSAKQKTYHYYLCLEQSVSPFKRLYCLHISRNIDLELLQQATSFFIGTHDFSSFANAQEEGAAKKNPVRTISAIDILSTENGLCLSFTGNGFLYKMVRNIVGLLLAVAVRKIPLEAISSIFEAKDRKKAPAPAPGLGLFLRHIAYTAEDIIQDKRSLLLW